MSDQGRLFRPVVPFVKDQQLRTGHDEGGNVSVCIRESEFFIVLTGTFSSDGRRVGIHVTV